MDAKIFANAPILAGNTVSDFVKSLPDSGAPIQEKDVLRFAIGQVNSGKPKDQVASEVRNFFEYGSKFQAAQKGLALLGMDLRNPKSKNIEYPISTDVFSFGDRFKDPRLVNAPDRNIQLFNQADVENFLTINAVKSRAAAAAAGIDKTMPLYMQGNPLAIQPLGGAQ
jgi:hypothetical protein